MNNQKRIDYFIQEIEATEKKIEQYSAELSTEDKYLIKCQIAYRLASVERILDFIRSEYRNGRICNLELLLSHCQNKLNGNLDCIELDLAYQRGTPFEVLPEQDEGKQLKQEGK